MSVQIERKKGVQIVRLLTDTVTESNAKSIKTVVELALSAGIKNFVFSIMEKTLADHSALSDLLMHCEKKIRHEMGKLSLIITPSDGGESLFRCNNTTLCIPVYSSEDDAIAKTLDTVPPSVDITDCWLKNNKEHN